MDSANHPLQDGHALHDAMVGGPWPPVDGMYGLNQTTDGALLDWSNLVLDNDQNSTTLPPMDPNPPQSMQQSVQQQPQSQPQPSAQSLHAHPQGSYQQAVGQTWHQSQGNAVVSQPQIMQEHLQTYELHPHYQLSSPSPASFSVQHQTQMPPPSQPQSYHDYALKPSSTTPELTQARSQHMLQNVQLATPQAQGQTALHQPSSQLQPNQHVYDSRHMAPQMPRISVDGSRALPQLAPAPARNPITTYELPAHLDYGSLQSNHHQISQPSYQQQQTNPYHNTINPQFLAHEQQAYQRHPQQTYLIPDTPNPTHSPVPAVTSSAVSYNSSQPSLDATSLQYAQTQAQPQTYPQTQTQGQQNFAWGSMDQQVQQTMQPPPVASTPQPYGTMPYQTQMPVTGQSANRRPSQVQGQKPAPQPQQHQLQPGAQYQRHGTNPPVHSNFQVQIPLKMPQPPRNGTIINLDSLKNPVRRSKKDSAKSKQAAQLRKSAGLSGAPMHVILDASSSDSSDYSSESENEGAITPEPSPLPPTRPSDPEGGARYDAMKAVWAPRNRRTMISTVRTALVAFSDVVKGMREQWKTMTISLKEAEAKKEEEKVKELKGKVELARTLLGVAINAAMEYGHPAVLQRLGEHPIVMSSLYSFLLDRHSCGDNDGPLTVDILKFMALFTTMDQGILEKTKVNKILPRLVKKGGEVTKKLAQQIMDNVAEETKRKAAEKKDQKPSPSKTQKPNVAATVSRDSSGAQSSASSQAASRQGNAPVGVKRERDADATGPPNAKRPITSKAKPIPRPTTASSSAAAALKRTPSTTQDAKARPATSGATATAAKPKPAATPAKPPVSLFGNLMSAHKKPGTSNAARAAAAAAAKDRPSGERKPVAKPTAFSFSAAMADLTKPKEPTPVQQEEKPKLNETEEEKATRLKKEKRRRLRVRFKPEAELAEVRLFTHDPEEEVRADPSMIKDVDDVGGEGRMLKLHLGEDDLDEDDEVHVMKEEELAPWVSLQAIDFTMFSEKERAANFIKFGGTKLPDSPEKAAQDQREVNNLPPLRMSAEDLPESPKEPAPPSEDEQKTETIDMGQPGELVTYRSDQYFESRNGRAATTTASQTQLPSATAGQQPLNNLSSLLGLFQPGAQQGAPGAAASSSSSPLATLEKTFSAFAQPAAASAPMQAPLQAQPPAIPAAAPQANQGFDLGKILAVINASKQLGAPAAPAAPAMPAMAPQPSLPQATTPAPNLGAILSQISGMSAQAQPQSQAQSQPQLYENEDRKRLREEGEAALHDPHGKKHKHGADGKKKTKGVITCRFWKEGNCLKGDDCTFRHG